MNKEEILLNKAKPVKGSKISSLKVKMKIKSILSKIILCKIFCSDSEISTNPNS
jgi:hypothetical protein